MIGWRLLFGNAYVLPSIMPLLSTEGMYRSLTGGFWARNELRSSTWPVSTYDLRMPPPQLHMKVGPWPAPTAVRILGLKASLAKKSSLIAWSGWALFHAATDLST